MGPREGLCHGRSNCHGEISVSREPNLCPSLAIEPVAISGEPPNDIHLWRLSLSPSQENHTISIEDRQLAIARLLRAVTMLPQPWSSNSFLGVSTFFRRLPFHGQWRIGHGGRACPPALGGYAGAAGAAAAAIVSKQWPSHTIIGQRGPVAPMAIPHDHCSCSSQRASRSSGFLCACHPLPTLPSPSQPSSPLPFSPLLSPPPKLCAGSQRKWRPPLRAGLRCMCACPACTRECGIHQKPPKVCEKIPASSRPPV